MALTDKLSAIGDAIRAKTGKGEKLTLDQMPGEIAGISGGGTLGALSVTENGTYNAAYEAATATWGENTEYDFTVEVEGIPLRVKKLAGFSVPDDVKSFFSPEYAATFKMPDGTEQAVPLKELELADFYGAGYLSDSLMYAVVWIKNASLFNESAGDTVFEDNSVYITDFLWLMADGELAGAELTLTAPGKKLDGISSVTVDVPVGIFPDVTKHISENGYYRAEDWLEVTVDVKPNLQPKTVTENGTVTADGDYDGLSQVTVNVPIPDGYVKPSGTKAITENGTHDVSGYAQAQVDVDIPEPVLQEKTVTENGEVVPDEGYDGLSKVTVAVESSGGGLAINGIIEQYKVNAGATVNAGDFVEFVTKFGSGGFNSGAAVFVVAEKIDNSRVLVAYEDGGNSYNLTAVVLTIDSGTVTVGAPLALTSYTSDQLKGRTNITVLSDSKALVCNTYGSSSYMIMLVSISGTTIRKVGNLTLTIGTAYTAITALSENTVIVAHPLNESGKLKTALTVLTISENTITKTSQKIVSSYQPAYGISLTVLTESTLLFTFVDYTNKCYKAAVVSVYDGVVSCGSFKTISSGLAYYPDAVRCADNKVLVVYSDGSNSNYGTAIVLTVDGTTVTAGTPVVFRSIDYNALSASVSALTDNKVVAVYRGDSGHGTAVILTVDGSTITVGAPTECDLNYTSGHAVVAFGEGSALAIFNNGAGIYCGLTIDGTTITSDGEMATYVKPATSRLHNVGVAATGGAEGETVDVYVVG